MESCGGEELRRRRAAAALAPVQRGGRARSDGRAAAQVLTSMETVAGNYKVMDGKIGQKEAKMQIMEHKCGAGPVLRLRFEGQSACPHVLMCFKGSDKKRQPSGRMPRAL
jgi:uncharacterized low-complexity protein